MRIPMKVDYGIRALVELAQHRTDGHVPTAEIARRQEIPEPYLDQLLGTLQKFGFIRSRRGPQGGHALAKSPGEINLEMVMATLEGMGEPLVCLEDPGECGLSKRVCTARGMADRGGHDQQRAALYIYRRPGEQAAAPGRPGDVLHLASRHRVCQMAIP